MNQPSCLAFLSRTRAPRLPRPSPVLQPLGSFLFLSTQFLFTRVQQEIVQAVAPAFPALQEPRNKPVDALPKWRRYPGGELRIRHPYRPLRWAPLPRGFLGHERQF